MSKSEVSISGDYAVLNAGGYDFYYGYEACWCHVCKKLLDAGSEYCEDHETDWCFQVKQDDLVLMTIPSSKLKAESFNVSESLLEGVGIFIHHLSEICGHYATKDLVLSAEKS